MSTVWWRLGIVFLLIAIGSICYGNRLEERRHFHILAVNQKVLAVTQELLLIRKSTELDEMVVDSMLSVDINSLSDSARYAFSLKCDTLINRANHRLTQVNTVVKKINATRK